MSPLLADIIKQLITGHIPLDVLAHFKHRTLLEKELLRIGPDLVLVGLRLGETDQIGSRLLKLVPAAKVIAFSSDARHAYLHDMRPNRAAIIDVSPRALIEAIRGPATAS